MLFENIECLTNTYKSGNLSGKLPKNTKCIYIYNYFMLIINDSLNKRFCKKVFGFNISLFRKCYIHNIFIINFHNIIMWRYSNIPYSFNIFINTLSHTQPNPFPFSFLFFSFFFFPSGFPQPQEPILHLL